MVKEVAGVPLVAFEDPIHYALERYSSQSDGEIEFVDADSVPKLELTPDKPNSARSTTAVTYLGETVGILFVIAFAPEDGTGDESAYRLADINTGRFPRAPKVVPRSKSAADSEAHLTIATYQVDGDHDSPYMYAGSLDLIGFELADPTKLRKIGQLGQPPYRLSRPGNPGASKPTTTLTTGYFRSGSREGAYGARFGDPHAVYNSLEDKVQLCGFLAISPEVAAQHPAVLQSLRAQEPDMTSLFF